MCPSSGLRAWQRPLRGSCRRMVGTSRKAQGADAAGKPCGSAGKEKNLIPEPPCGHTQARQAAVPAAAPRDGGVGDPGALTQGGSFQCPISGETHSAALSSSHPPVNPRDKDWTETKVSQHHCVKG